MEKYIRMGLAKDKKKILHTIKQLIYMKKASDCRMRQDTSFYYEKCNS